MTSIGKEGIIGNQMNGRRRPVYLTGSEDCPAYGAMEIYGYTYTGGLMVRKPTADDLPPHLVCFATDVEIRSGSFGVASQNWPVVAKYDNSGLAVSNREAVGTKAGEWRLFRGYEGFLAVGSLQDTGYIAVMPEVVCRQSTAGLYYGSGGGSMCPTGCCGCADGYSSWPSTLTATVDISCFVSGPFVVTLTGGPGAVVCGRATSGTPGDFGVIIHYDGTLTEIIGGLGEYFGTYCYNESLSSSYEGEAYRTINVGVDCVRYLDVNMCWKSAWQCYVIQAQEYTGGVIRIVGLTMSTNDYPLSNAEFQCSPFILSGGGNIECYEPGVPLTEAGYSIYTNCVGATFTIGITE